MNEKIIKLLSCFIPSKKLRHKFRDKYKLKTSIMENSGENNKLILFDDDGNELDSTFMPGLKVFFKGNNSTVKLYKSTFFPNGIEILLADDCYFECGKTKHGLQLDCFLHMNKNNTKIIIGNNCWFCGVRIHISQCPDTTVKIGNDCMLSRDVVIRPTDGHTIYDSQTKRIISRPQDIIIGKHCWIGEGVAILKGSIIPDNSIVGIKSLWTRGQNAITERISGGVFAGTPVRLIKSGVNWDHKGYCEQDFFSDDE